MSGLAQTFQVADKRWFYNAVDSRLYRVGADGGELPSPAADVHFGLSEAELRKGIGQAPKILTLGVTEQCNLRCRYCVYSGAFPLERAHNDRRMSEDAALRGVDEYFTRSAGADQAAVTFFGGEPLKAFGLIERVVQHVKQHYPNRHCKFAITTNGVKLSGPTADFLVKERFVIGVSLDGPQAVHNANRLFPSKTGCWEEVVKNLAALQTAAPDFYRTNVALIAVLADPRRIAEMHDFFTTDPLVRENGLVVTPVRTIDADPAFFPQLTPEEKAAYEDYLENLGRQFADDVLLGRSQPDRFAEALFSGIVRSIHTRSTSPLEETQLPTTRCLPGEKLFLSADGTYYTCPNLAGTLPLGDSTSGFDPEKGLAAIQAYQTIAEKECRHCWAVRFCHACMLRARHGDHLTRERLREWCPTFLHQLERAFRIYLAVATRDREGWANYFSTRSEDPFSILGD